MVLGGWRGHVIIDGVRYAAFLSYSRAVDLQLSADVARALQNYSKPWYRLRALRIFRDVSVLSANSDAWGAVERGLDESEFLILFASPDAAASSWVRREVKHWVANRPPGTILLALTGGEVGWDPGTGDFDWTRTTALPREVLRGVFPHEPNYVDLRRIRSLSGPDRRRALADVIADLAAPLHHRSKDDMVGEEYRVLRRNRRLAVTAAAAFVALAVLAVVFAVQSGATRSEAEQQRRVALSRQLATQSESLGDTDPDRARQLAATAWRLDQNADTQQGLASASLLAELHVLPGHQDAIQAVAFSRDGTRLATASSDGTVRIWNAATAGVIATLTGHPGRARLVAFSPDGSRLASAGDDDTVRVWDTASGELTETLDAADVLAMTFDVDGRELWTAAVPKDVESPVISHWDPSTGTLLGKVNTDGRIANHMAFSRDGGTLAADVADSVELFDSVTGFSQGIIDGHFPFNVGAIALSPDGNLLAVGLNDGTASLWNTATDARLPLDLQPQANSVTSLAFSPDGQTIAAGTVDSAVRLWNTATGHPIPTSASGGGGPVLALAFGPDGATLAVAGLGGTVGLWPAPAAPITALTGHTATVTGVAFSPDSASLVTTSEDGTARLWSSTGAPLAKLPGSGPVLPASFSPDDATVLTADTQAVRLWRAATGKAILTMDDPIIVAFAVSPDARTIATVTATDTDKNEAVQLWNASTGARLRTLSGHSGEIEAIAFSPFGAAMATASDDDTARLWNPATGTTIATLTGHTGPVTSVAFSPDGKAVATISDDGTARLWNAATGVSIATLRPSGQPLDMAFSPDSTTLATADSDGTVELWNTIAGGLVRTLRGHVGAAQVVVYSEDGRTLATGGADRTVRLWNASTGANIAILTGHTGAVWALAFSPDGTVLASAAIDDSTARLWRVSFRTDPYKAVCAQIGRPLTAAEWNAYAPGIPYESVC